MVVRQGRDVRTNSPVGRNTNIGFRCARDDAQPEPCGLRSRQRDLRATRGGARGSFEGLTKAERKDVVGLLKS